MVREHSDAVRTFARRALGDPHLAEDVVQEVLMRAWSHPEVLDRASGPVRGWLLRVARNVIIDTYRRRAARPSEAALPAERELVGGSPGLDVAMLDKALDSLVLADALRRVSSEHREVLVELYLRERTLAEAALTLGVPVGTVKSRAHYALRALRAQLGPQGANDD